MITRARVIAEARKWLGTPFRHRGRNRVGLDCAGLVVVVAEALGIDLSDADPATYDKMPAVGLVQKQMAKGLRRRPISTLAAGDIVQIVDDLGDGRVCHMAIVSDLRGGLGLIHAYPRLGYDRVVEHTLDAGWRDRIVGVFCYRPLED